MMRTISAVVLALLILASTSGTKQAAAQQQGRVPEYARSQPQPGSTTAARNSGDARQRTAATSEQAQVAAVPSATRPAAPVVPFPPLSAEAQASLQQLLDNWQQQSQSTKTLDCKFKRWHYDLFAAPAGIHATHAEGVIRYAKPDKGLFRVDNLLFFNGMVGEKPQFKAQPNKFGEHWVCNGEQLIEFDRSKKECRIQTLPKNLQGQQIFNSPLPFVFNLDAQQIQKRYWVRQVDSPKEGVVLIEAWPKLQEDRAQYKLVQIALDEKTYVPQALIMYAPNFNAKTAPRWDHYEFLSVKRNGIGHAINKFIQNFIPEEPPSDWTILRDNFVAPTLPPGEPATKRAATDQRPIR